MADIFKGEDHFYMKEALAEAEKALELDEVPVGAVVVKGDEIISRASNLRETRQDATAHAELMAIKKACEALKTWRLTGCRLYVTLEPCPMCAGAIILARLDKVIIGAKDPKSGACGSIFDIPADPRLNHRSEVEFGVLAQECGDILRRFFKAKRDALKAGDADHLLGDPL